MSLSREQLVTLYTNMLEIRLVEQRLADLYAQALVPRIVHLCIGQEAVPVGTCAHLRNDDYVFGTHRGHGSYIAKGGALAPLIAEILGKKKGCCKGKGGTMLLSDVSVGFLGTTSVVGQGIPIAAGAGLSIRFKKTDQVSVCFFGEGAAQQGVFHETLNLAALWRLPMIFVCENNSYAISTPFVEQQATANVADRAVAYGIPGEVVDGMDVIAVYRAAGKAVERARQGQGPCLLECKTYRFCGQSEAEKERETSYRSNEEVQRWRKRCPIENLRKQLLETEMLTPAQDADIQGRLRTRIEDAVRFAIEAALPLPEEALEDVYA